MLSSADYGRHFTCLPTSGVVDLIHMLLALLHASLVSIQPRRGCRARQSPAWTDDHRTGVPSVEELVWSGLSERRQGVVNLT